MLALAAIVLWWWAGPKVLRAHIVADVFNAAAVDQWRVEWTKASTGDRHGAYAELEDGAPRILEIEIGPREDAPDDPFEFWLYNVRTDSGIRPDLVGLLDRNTNPDAKGWIPFDQGLGLTYIGPGPGRLTIPLDSRTVALGIGRTARSGNVVASFRGETVNLNAWSPMQSSDIVVIPRGMRHIPEGELGQRLPAYNVAEAFVSWEAPPGSTVAMTNPRVAFAIANYPLFERPLHVEPAQDVEAAAADVWRVSGASPSVRLAGQFRPGAMVFVVGSVVTFLSLIAALVAARLLAVLVRLVVQWKHAPAVGVALIVLAVHCIVALYSPTMISGDGMDYLDAADHLATQGSFDRFPIYKAPGLSVLLAGAMWVSDSFLDTYAWMMAALAVSMSLMAYYTVRTRASHAWALAAALFVGVHPSLITYESYLLRELPSAAVLMGVALAIFGVRDRLGRGIPWGWTIALALLCAVGAYLRENLQLLIPMVPLIILLPGPGAWGRRAVAAGVVLALSAGLLLPRIIPIYQSYGTVSVVSPKIEGNRTLSAWFNRISDGNLSEIFTEDQWLTIRNTMLQRGVSDYDFTVHLIILSKYAEEHPPDAVLTVDNPLRTERMHRFFLDEATAREPLSSLKASVRAFISQIGLWNVQTGVIKNAASANEWYSKPLRGEPLTFATNFAPDAYGALKSGRLNPNIDRLLALVKANRRSVKHLEGASVARLFNEWFFAFRAVRPGIAVLFLIGAGAAVWRRDYTIAGVCAVVLLSTFGAAFVVGTPTDRFGVPFLPIMVCIAAITAAGLWNRRSVRHSTTALTTPT